MRTYKQEFREKLADKILSGFKQNDISRKYNVPQSTLHNWVTEYRQRLYKTAWGRLFRANKECGSENIIYQGSSYIEDIHKVVNENSEKIIYFFYNFTASKYMGEDSIVSITYSSIIDYLYSLKRRKSLSQLLESKYIQELEKDYDKKLNDEIEVLIKAKIPLPSNWYTFKDILSEVIRTVYGVKHIYF